MPESQLLEIYSDGPQEDKTPDLKVTTTPQNRYDWWIKCCHSELSLGVYPTEHGLPRNRDVWKNYWNSIHQNRWKWDGFIKSPKRWATVQYNRSLVEYKSTSWSFIKLVYLYQAGFLSRRKNTRWAWFGLKELLAWQDKVTEIRPAQAPAP